MKLNITDLMVHPKQIMDRKATSKTPEKFFGEATDNSISAGASRIRVTLNEQKRTILHQDNGKGVDTAEAFRQLHQPYSDPELGGISKFGIGSKIFLATGAQKRFLFSRSVDPLSGKEEIRASYWDVSQLDTTLAPTAIFTSAACLESREHEEFYKKIKEHNVLDRWQNFLSSETTGVWTLLVDVDLCSKEVPWSSLYVTIQKLLGLKYGYLKEQFRENGELDINITWISGKGEMQSSTPVYANPFKGMEKKTRTVDATPHGELITFRSKDTSHDFGKDGIWVFRSGVFISTEPFYKITQGKVKELNTGRTADRVTHVRQLLLFTPQHDEEMNIAETKDGVDLPASLRRTAADRLTKLRTKEKTRKTTQVKKDLVKPKKGKNNPISVEENLNVIFADEGKQAAFSYLGSKPLEVYEGTVFWELLQNSNKAGQQLIKVVLTAIREEHIETGSPQLKSSLCKAINSIGVRIEAALR